MGKEIKINMRPSRKYDGMKYKVKKMLDELQADADYRKSMMAYYDDIKSFQDSIDALTEQIWLSFVVESVCHFHPEMVIVGFAWYYGLKEGLIKKDWPYDQVVYFIRRKVIFRLVEVLEK